MIHPMHNSTLGEGENLATVTVERLFQFRQRRLLLASLRGLAMGTVLCVAALLCALALDASVEDPFARWIGSLLVYATLLLALFRWCLRPWLSRLEFTEEARQIEAYVPSIHDHLLSAVELAQREDSQVADSSAFRRALQRQVAEAIAPVDVRQLLPWGRIARRVAAGLFALALLGLLCLIPTLHFPQRIARILLPIADVGRVSWLAIHIERPMPASKMLPRGDVAAITAVIDGPQPDQVELQTRTATNRQSMSMTWLQPQAERKDGRGQVVSRYEATLATDYDWIEYRVCAEGASTPWYRISTHPRPEVLGFRKTITAPSYSNAVASVLTETHGDIRALIGSRIDLALNLDQPVSSAEIRWEPLDEPASGQVTKLEWDKARQQLLGHFTIHESRSYRVFLQSAATGFTNAFSPSYRVIALDDVAPLVQWLQPTSPSVTAAATEILGLSAKIADELPVRELIQFTRINSGDWQQTVLPTGDLEISPSDAAAPYVATLDWQFDLLPLAVQSGDYIETKLVVHDQRGSLGESAVVQIMVTSTSIDLAATDAEIGRRQIAEQLTGLAEAIATRASTLSKAGQGQIEQAKALSESMRVQTLPILAEVKRVSSLTADRVGSMELRLVGEVLARLHSVDAGQLEQLATQLGSQDGLARMVQFSKNVDGLTSGLALHLRTLASHDSFGRHAEQLARLAIAQAELAQDTDDSAEQLQRRQAILTRQTKDVRQSVLESLDHVRKESRDRLRQVADQLGNFIAQAEEQTDLSDKQALQRLASNLARSLSGAKMMARMDGGLPDAIKRSQRWLNEQRDDPSRSLRDLASSMVRQPPPEMQVTDILEQLGQHREVVRAGQAANLEFAADLGNTGRAVKSSVESASVNDPNQVSRMEQVGQALRTLAAAAEVSEASAQLNELLRGERWKLDTSAALTEHPRLWDALAGRMESAVKMMRAAKIPNELVDQLERLRGNPSAQKISQRISDRRWELEPVVSAADDLEKQATRLHAFQLELAPLVRAARLQLNSLAPTISELAKKAASETEQLSRQTRSLSEAMQRDEVPSPETRLLQLEQQLEQLDEPMTELRNALVDQADAQSLLDTHSLQTARTADAGINIVDRAEEQAKRSLEQVAPNANQSEQSESLAEAARKQQDAANALGRIASLFEESPQSLEQQFSEQMHSSKLASLADAAQQLEPGNKNSDSSAEYDRARQLAELAEASPEELLRKLEEELHTNVPMQGEMSEISRAAAAQALEGLDQAAEQQHAIVPDLESSDPALRAQKQLLVHDLQTTGENASEILNFLLSESKWTSGAAKEGDVVEKLEEAELFLRSGLEQANSVGPELPYADLQATAGELRRVLHRVHEQLAAQGQQLQEASVKQIHSNGADLSNRRREMKDRQRRIGQQDSRNAQNADRIMQQKMNQATKEWEQAQQRVANESKKIDELGKRLEKNPQDKGLEKQLADLQRQNALSRVAETAAQNARDGFQKRTDQSKRSLQEVNQQPQAELASANPAAELASQLTELAARRSAQLAEALAIWTDGDSPVASPTAQQLQSNLARQAGIRDEVDRASQHLSRAARHEMRLENSSTSQQLAALAAGVEQVSQGEVQLAQEQLSAAALTAGNNRSSTGQASPAAMAAAAAATFHAEAAIRKSADSLRSVLAKQQGPAPASSPDSPQPGGEPTSPNMESESLNSQQMAQLLDELDRQLHQDLNLGEKEDDSQSPPSASDGQPPPGTLAEAAQQLGSELSRSRQPTPASANPDFGTATESQIADVNPQAPVGVQVLDVDRIDGNWGELRARDAEDSVETRRDNIAPQYRQQVEAYFRSLSIQGRKREGASP